MIKVGIELPDKNISEVDISTPEKGNPGVGGSEYLFALLGVYLRKHCKHIKVTFYHYSNNILPHEIENVIVSDEYSMLNHMSINGIDILIHQISKPSDWYDKLSETKLKAISWAHIYPEYREQRDLIRCNNVKRVVFVGKEEYDAYIDSDLVYKSACIYNMLNTKINTSAREKTSLNVTYVGSLVPAKGFHILAQAWPEIIKRVPNAQLFVIGTGKVYNRQAILGKYGIAQTDYEQRFMKYLTDADGRILQSVNFLGLLGQEKEKIFQKTSVGVVNPTALTETFCMSAVEMELCGIPVVSKKKWGLLDTVIDGETGYLVKSVSGLCRAIVKLLRNKEQNEKMGIQARKYVQKSFDADYIIDDWISLIHDVMNDAPANYLGVNCNYFNDYKWIRIIIRFLRIKLHLKKIPDFESVKNGLRNFRRRK